ncbi:unnamed protein product [Diabrotica balteata]|uniref:Uncharacterized protein n=1 Tax=Diabrotica balteata TaxID=107213 RepID=A0A9N9SY47_DIABA|nr:unnamed protein product [Diabrotica balteata]
MEAVALVSCKDVDIKETNDTEVKLSIDGKQIPESKQPLLVTDKESSFKLKPRLNTTNLPYIRAVAKNGDCNIYPSNVQKKRFLRDIFTTLIDMKWRYTFTVFSLGFIITWTIFAILWWFIAYYHGDLDDRHLPMNQMASNWTPCVTDIYNFRSCFLFSVETQQTTGYGEKRPTEKCADAVVLMCVQNVVGLLVDACLVGVFFAKLTRPKLRTQTIQFSKYAVIAMRENVLCLMIRLGDLRERSRIIEAKVKAQLVRQRLTKQGDTFSNYLTKLRVTIDDCENDLLFIWPMTIVHKIDSSSPFYNISKQNLTEHNFEIIISLEGTIESTDQKTQVRSSYLANEILWGYQFASLMSICQEKSGYRVDYTRFDDLVQVDTPAGPVSEFKNRNRNNKETYIPT